MLSARLMLRFHIVVIETNEKLAVVLNTITQNCIEVSRSSGWFLRFFKNKDVLGNRIETIEKEP